MIALPLYRFRAGLAHAVERVRRGEIVVLTRHGKPVARLMPIRHSAWNGMQVIAPSIRRPARIRPFRGPGTMSREIIQERRRRG